MPIPLIPLLAAFASGANIVSHAAGGVIASGASGYVAGTYLSTSAIASLLASTGTAIGVTAIASGLIGSAGIFGTTIGATGLTGVLMTAGILPSVPIVVPIAAGGALAGTGYVAYVLFCLKQKVKSADNGQEVQFTDLEAKIIEIIIKLIGKQQPGS